MLNITTISDVIYRDFRYNLIRIAEGSSATPYIDSRGNVTIGIGFNLNAAVIRNRVLSELGIQSGTQAFNNITNILRINYLNQYSTEAQRLTLQNNINQMLSANGMTPLTDPQIQNIFNDLITGFETTVNSWMQKHAIPTIGNSRERAVLASLAYNSKVEENQQSPNYGYPTTLGLSLAKALGGTVNGKTYEANRAEAWFEIRYNTNPNPATATDAPGMARRRYAESQLFGLYDNPNNPNAVTLAEAEQVFRMYQNHRTKIQEYEHLFGELPNYSAPIRGNRITMANNDFGTYLIGAGVGEVTKLEVELNPAKAALFTYLKGRSDLPDLLKDKLTDTNIVSTNIYLNPHKPTDTDRTSVLDSKDYQTGTYLVNGANDLMIGMDQRDTMFGRKGNDILIGEGGIDCLWGEEGNDVLYGGEGDDMLIGGIGNDILMGGEDDDSYVINAGDGEDTIEDKQGNNKIYLRGKELNFSYDASTGKYKRN